MSTLPASTDAELSPTEKELIQLVRGLRFGSVEIHVHESRIVQIERRERRRFDEPKPR